MRGVARLSCSLKTCNFAQLLVGCAINEGLSPSPTRCSDPAALWKPQLHRTVVSSLPPPPAVLNLTLRLRAFHNQSTEDCSSFNRPIPDLSYPDSNVCIVVSKSFVQGLSVSGAIRSPNKRWYFFLSSRFTWLVNLFNIAKTKTRKLLVVLEDGDVGCPVLIFLSFFVSE